MNSHPNSKYGNAPKFDKTGIYEGSPDHYKKEIIVFSSMPIDQIQEQSNEGKKSRGDRISRASNNITAIGYTCSGS